MHASFCMGPCLPGISTKVSNRMYTSLLSFHFMANTSPFLRLADSPFVALWSLNFFVSPSCFFGWYHWSRFSQGKGGGKEAKWYKIDLGRCDILFLKSGKARSHAIFHFHDVPVGWLLRGLVLKCFAFVHVEHIQISHGSFTELVGLYSISGPFTGNLMLDSQPGSEVDKGLI